MVIYSGGNFLRGPQTSGLLLGRKDLIQAAWRNASPHQAFARGMKVSKEDVIGVLAALEVWFEHRDPAVELARWNADLATIAGRLYLPGVGTEVIAPQGVVRVPRLRVRWDAARFGLDGEALRLRVLDGEPRVMLDDTTVTRNSIEIDPFGLQPGEAEQVGRAIAAALSAPVAAHPAPAVPTIDVSGAWEVHVRFLHGERSHRLTLQQQGGAITGSQSSLQFDGPVTGSLDADVIHLIFRTRDEGATISDQLDGAVADGRMQGTVVLGSASDHHKGPINLTQFGTGQFQAVRAGGVMDGFVAIGTSSGRPEWLRMRQGLFTGPTSGMAPGFVQANLVVLPRALAFDFLLFTQGNPSPVRCSRWSKPASRG